MPICPNCGEDNPARARFCMACTARLSGAGRQEVRKTVTVVFCDLKGSTNLGEALDPESFRDVMGRYFERMQHVLEHHGATVEKFIGDAVMAVFGLPRVHEDDALRAVRAAWEMRRTLQELNDELDSRWGVRLLNRTGVNTGEVVAGDPSIGQRLVTGDPVNTAARLEQAAGPGEVLVGESTYRLVRDAVGVEAVGPLAVKGKAEPVTAYRLLEVLAEAAPLMRRMDTPMIGRRRELGLLRAALDRAIGRRGCELVTVMGEPGMGKSRLLLEFEAITAGRARVLRGRCPAYGQGITFFPLGEIIRDAARDGGRAAAQNAAPDGEGITTPGGAEDTTARLAALVEEHNDADAVAARVGAALGLSSEPFPLEEIFWGVRSLLAHLARDRPLVAEVEDIHWAEPAFLDLLDHLRRTTEDASILLVCSARPDLLEERPDWQSDGETIGLESLSGKDADRLIVNLLGSSELPASAQARIREAAEGNPLFIEQILSMLMDEGYLAGNGDRWRLERDLHGFSIPPTISALLSARLDGLPAEERSIIERASVPGQVFRRAAVVELCDEPLRARIDPCLSALTRKAFVQPEHEGPGSDHGRFRFRHVLIRDAAYGGMLKKLRAELHELFAVWLEAEGGEEVSEREELLGYHLEQAYRYRTELAPPDDHAVLLGSRAGRWLAAAGRRAMARGDVGAGAKLLHRGVDLLPPDEPDRLLAMVELGGALRERGDRTAAIEVLDRAIEEAKQRADIGLECRGLVERFEVDMKHDTPGWPDRAFHEAQRLIPLLEAAGDDLGLAKIWRMLSWVHGERGSLAGWDEASWRSIEYSRRVGNRREEIEVLAGLTINATFGSVPADEGIGRCEEVLQSVEGNRRAEAFVLEHLGHLQAMVGRFEEARATVRRSVEMYDDIGAFGHASRVRVVAASVEMLAEDPAAAARMILEMYRLRELRGLGGPMPWVDVELANVRCEQGRSEEALPLAERATEVHNPVDLTRALGVKGRVLARLGRMAEGEACARQAVAQAAVNDYLLVRGEVWMGLGEVLSLAGRGEEAAAAFEEAMRLWKRKGNVVMAARTERALASVIAQC